MYSVDASLSAFRNINNLYEDLDAIFDTPSKKTLWTFIIPLMSAQDKDELRERIHSPNGGQLPQDQRKTKETPVNEPCHEIMVLFVLRKLVLQTRMRSHPMELNVWFLVGPFVYFHSTCVRTSKALTRLRGCADSPEPSLVAFVISTIISRTGSNMLFFITP